MKAIKVATAKPEGKVIYLDVPKSTDQKIGELRRKLNLDEKWQQFVQQVRMESSRNNSL